MTGFDNHEVVTSKDLAFWLFNEASDHGVSIWKQQRTTLRATQYTGPVVYKSRPDFIFDAKTLTKADIMNEVWATYSTDENTTGIYITGYSVGDGKSGYANNQNVIAADIAYREAVTPSDRVFKVFLEGDPDETNKGYFASNTVGEIVTFVIRTNVSIEEQPITINSRSATHTTPTSAVYDSTSDYYYYTFDVELTTTNSGSNTIGEVFSVTQGTASSDVVVYIPATPSDRVFKVFLQGDPDETNKGYFASNNTGETVTFVVRTNVPIEDIPIVISGRSATHTTPTSAVFDSESDYYYYTFDVELTTTNSGSNVIGEVFSVTQGTSSSDVVVYIPGTVEGTAGLLYTNMPYVYTIGDSQLTHNLTNGGYNTTNIYNYSFVANLGTSNGAQTVNFLRLTIPGRRISTRSNIPGMSDITIIRNGFKINQPVVFQLNVGGRIFAPRSAQSVTIQPDSTTFFGITSDVDGNTSYNTPYTDYFVTSGTDIKLDTSFGTNGATTESGSLKAKLADSGNTGTLTIKGNTVTTKQNGDWWLYDLYDANPDVFNIDKLDNEITLNNAGNFRIVAYKQSGTTLRLMIAGNGTGNTYPTGWNVYADKFGDTITGTINGSNATFEIIRPKFSAYILSSVYVEIKNYDPASQYVINMPNEPLTLNQSTTLCTISYSFGSGTKCLDPDALTTSLWKPNLDYSPLPIYGNLSKIKLGDVYVRDGNVPRCENSYVKFRLVDDTKELIQYEMYVDDIRTLLTNIDPKTTLHIRIYSIYDSSAKRQDEFDPGATIINGFYSVSNKNYILASVIMDGDTPHVKFCTTGGYYSKDNPVAQSTVAVETFDVASQYFDNANTTMFNIGGSDGYAGRGVFDGFIELAAGSNINIIGTMHAIDMSSPFDDEEP